jgi:hypothetical protein
MKKTANALENIYKEDSYLYQKTITKLNDEDYSETIRLILQSFDRDSEVGFSPTHIIQEHLMEWSEAEAPKTRKTSDMCVEWLIAHQFCNYYLNNKKSNSFKKNNSKIGIYYFFQYLTN